MQYRQIQSSGVALTKLCHPASTKHAYKKGLQFFTVLASSKCINCKVKELLGCIILLGLTQEYTVLRFLGFPISHCSWGVTEGALFK